MTFVLPDLITENSLDDIQSIDLSINSLIQKFIIPIERIRSMSAPSIIEISRTKDEDGKIIQAELDNANVDNSSAQESRAHAFYRMIGLPVIDQNFNIYNPGFNPRRSDKARTQNNSIADNVSQIMRLMARARETSTRERYAIFKRGGIDASVYGLVLPILRKFQVIDTKKDFTSNDEQKITIQKRKSFIETNFDSGDTTQTISKFFEAEQHVLRPFTVDSNIERTVMPANRLICEPFLKTINDTQIDVETFLPRPALELILRLRLRQSQEQADSFSETIFALNPVLDTQDVALVDLRRIALALLNEENINDDELLKRLTATDLELVVINNYIRLIKAVVDMLIEAVETISNIALEIDWTPLPGTLGPERGSNVGAFVVPRRTSSMLERRIIQLDIKSANAKRQPTISLKNLGTYSTISFENVENLFDNELAEAKTQKLDYIRLGSEALRVIEVITGEISGLGLIDILAIYTALWSVDIDILLSLLDDNAFQRLYDNNPELRTSHVVNRNSSGPTYNGFDALQKFEKQIINILAFTDKLVEQKLSSPNLSEGGSF